MLKSFKEVQEQEAAFDTRDRGTRMVPLERIVGSVGRYHDFDERFRIRSHLPAERLEKIKSKMKAGKAMPPVKLYQIKNEYYALDGNHRIAAANELGYGEIKAQIIEFIPSKGSKENLLYREKSLFDDRTQLPHDIELTDFGQYEHLIEQITKHRDYLEKTDTAPVSFQIAAKDWFETIYEPFIVLLKMGV